MNRNETLILSIFDRALQLGENCPSNNQLCEILGYSSTASASMLVAGLADAGMIVVTHLNRSSRKIAITDAGRAWLSGRPAMHAPQVTPKLPRTGTRPNRVTSVAHLPPVGDSEERKARTEAETANDRFLAAMRRVAVPVEPPAPREAMMRMLPPPALTGQAFS